VGDTRFLQPGPIALGRQDRDARARGETIGSTLFGLPCSESLGEVAERRVGLGKRSRVGHELGRCGRVEGRRVDLDLDHRIGGEAIGEVDRAWLVLEGMEEIEPEGWTSGRAGSRDGQVADDQEVGGRDGGDGPHGVIRGWEF
jgi:hypothetical protein